MINRLESETYRPILIPGIAWGSLVLALLLLITGCARWPAPTPSIHAGSGGVVGQCADFFSRLDAETVRVDAADAGLFRVPGYPYLRTDRFLASAGSSIHDDDELAAWIDRMQALDQASRWNETGSLAGETVRSFASDGRREKLFERIDFCGDRLRQHDEQLPDLKERLVNAVVVPDEYIAARQWLGLYPISRFFVSLSVRRWHVEARAQYQDAVLKVQDVRRYAPVEKGDMREAGQIVNVGRRDPLGIPAFTPAQRDILFHTHAPVWEIRQPAAADRIGSPSWDRDDRLTLRSDQPQTYTHLSYAHFNGAVVTQLNYVIWFPERPKAGILDIYGGWLDGIHLRVTLNGRGEPLLYETIHNCGCYYKAFVTHRLMVRESVSYAEPLLTFKMPAATADRQRVVVVLSAGDHTVLRIDPEDGRFAADAVPYTLADYDSLKRLARSNGLTKSMFDRYGLVTGSERLERFILWPTGVLSPGAMRVRGRHAVAFVGKRHFDDPDFMDRIFTPAAPGSKRK